jgi:hypothetical protein
MLIDNFNGFNISVVSHSKNFRADSLDIANSRLTPLEYFESSRFSIEFLCKTSISLIIGKYLRVMNKYRKF